MILPLDYENEEGYRDFRPRMQKKQRLPPVVQLCKDMMPDIRTIGESVKAFEEDIKFLSEAIINEFGNDEYFNNALFNTFNAVILEQPHKQPAIALLTMVVNSGNPIAGKNILNYFFDRLQECCHNTFDENLPIESNETGAWNKIKLILRFLSLLSPMIIIDDLMELYQRFLKFAIELNNLDPVKRIPLSEAIYTNTLINIPYLFFYQSKDETLKMKVSELIDEIEINYKVKSTDISLTKKYNKAIKSEDTHWVQTILANVKNSLANNMQQLKELFSDYQHMLPSQSHDQGFNDPLNLPTLEQIQPFIGLDKGMGSVDSMWKTPRYSFQVYLPNTIGDFATVVPITTYAGILFNDIIIDIVESMEFNRHEVAKQVITLDLYFKPGFFAEPGLSVTQLLAQYEENPHVSTYKIEDLAIENILGLIFKLPTVSQSFAYFYTLLVEICQNSPKAIAPVFGRAFRLFYNNLDSFDFELKTRYLDWFSIQMSNFNFSWKWNEWESDSIKLGQSFYNPKISFIKNLIRGELRLTSNRSDVEDSLTHEFQKYLDTSYIPKPQLKEYYQSLFNEEFQVKLEDVKGNDLYFRKEFIPFSSDVQSILDYFHKQPLNRDVNELESILESLKNEYGTIIKDFNKFSIVLLIHVLVYSGNRSLSHAVKYISDSKADLETIFSKIDVPNDIKELWIVEAVIRYWNSNSQNGFLISDTLKNNGMVSQKAILSFSFTEYEGRVVGLVDSTSIESTFRNLTELSLTRDTNVEIFEFVFEKLCTIINECVSQLNTTEEIIAPIIDDNVMIDLEEELPKLEIMWKYEAAMGFIKSILRKYSDEYALLLGKFRNSMNLAVTHEPTKLQLLKWFDEMSEL